MLIWYPKTNVGPQLYIRKYVVQGGVMTGNTTVDLGMGAPFTLANWKVGGYQDYSSYFT